MLYLLIAILTSGIRQHNVRVERIVWQWRRLYAAVGLGCSASDDYGPPVERPSTLRRNFERGPESIPTGRDAQAINRDVVCVGAFKKDIVRNQPSGPAGSATRKHATSQFF